MAMSIGDLTSEIKGIIEKGIDADRLMPAHWIVHAVLQKHPVAYDQDKVGAGKCDSAYAELARHELARAHVRRVLRLFKKPDPEMPTLPGFARLLRAYSINRDDDEADDDELNETIVPVNQMSDDELHARAEAYRAMGRGCFEHADEIDRYVVQRRHAA